MKSGPICCIVFFILLLLASPFQAWAQPTAAGVNFDMFTPSSRINNKVESAISALLKRKKDSKSPPKISEIAPLLEYMLVVDGNGGRTHPEKRSEGMGVYWRGVLNKPFAESLRYFYNPNIPSEILYPSSLRQGFWEPGSDILSLKKPIWEMFETLGEQPVVLTGRETEEITPDNYSGCYYIYTQARVLVLLRYKGVPMLLSISWQDGKSDAGMKGNFLGDYDDWDFVYTKAVGGTAPGIGWMSTYMYASSNITLLFPLSDGSTCYSMFKWLRAGWSGLNVVKRDHITSGANRNFRGMLEVVGGAGGIAFEELEAISKKYDSLGREAMLAEARPYAAQLAKLSKNDEILKRDEFQAVLANGIYAETLSDDELRSLLKVLALKRKLGKPVLGD